MKKKRFLPSPAAALVLTALICGILFSGCSKPDAGEESTPSAVQSTLSCDDATQALTLTDADPAQLKQMLALLPNLQTLTLEGRIPSVQTLLGLKAQFPDLTIACQVPLAGNCVSTDISSLDLSGTAVTMEALSEVLPLFSNLQTLDLMDTELTDGEKQTLCRSLPGVLVRCLLPLGEGYFPTDSETIDLSHTPLTVEAVEAQLDCFPRLKKLDLSFCGISDEEMDAFRQRHPETDIVWTVRIGILKVRTDALSFYPAGENHYPGNEEVKKLRYCRDLIAIDLGHTPIRECDFLWHTPKVKYLILADTGIKDITPVGNLKELIYLELFDMYLKDYTPLLGCTKLQDLNIGTTHADPEPLSKMTWLHNLHWHRGDQDPATREAVLRLPEQLPDTNVVLFPVNKARNIGGAWRYLPNYYVFRDIIGATYFNQDQIHDYWGQADGDRILACEGGKAFSAETLARIVRQRIDRGEPIIGIKNTGSEKAELLCRSLLESTEGLTEHE